VEAISVHAVASGRLSLIVNATRLRLNLSYTLVCSNKLSAKNKHTNAPIYMMKELTVHELTSTFHALKLAALQPCPADGSAPRT
jgi:hypothetical protein